MHIVFIAAGRTGGQPGDCWRCKTPVTVAGDPTVRASGRNGTRLMVANSKTAWGWPAKALHWIAAAAILVLLVHGWWMTHVTARPERLANYAWHSALGYDLLLLLLLRLLWRSLNAVPELPRELKTWERLAARA